MHQIKLEECYKLETCSYSFGRLLVSNNKVYVFNTPVYIDRQSGFELSLRAIAPGQIAIIYGEDIENCPKGIKGRLIAIDCSFLIRKHACSYVVIRQGKFVLMKGVDVHKRDIIVGRVLMNIPKQVSLSLVK